MMTHADADHAMEQDQTGLLNEAAYEAGRRTSRAGGGMFSTALLRHRKYRPMTGKNLSTVRDESRRTRP